MFLNSFLQYNTSVYYSQHEKLNTIEELQTSRQGYFTMSPVFCILHYFSRQGSVKPVFRGMTYIRSQCIQYQYGTVQI